ncbi:MAG: hypothetical protein ACJ71T_01010 [Actinomycetales bacterium]
MVVYAASMAKGATDTTMFALNAATGSTLWSFAAGSSVNAGAVVAKDTVYWGSGYGNLGPTSARPTTGSTPSPSALTNRGGAGRVGADYGVPVVHVGRDCDQQHKEAATP